MNYTFFPTHPIILLSYLSPWYSKLGPSLFIRFCILTRFSKWFLSRWFISLRSKVLSKVFLLYLFLDLFSCSTFFSHFTVLWNVSSTAKFAHILPSVKNGLLPDVLALELHIKDYHLDDPFALQSLITLFPQLLPDFEGFKWNPQRLTYS